MLSKLIMEGPKPSLFNMVKRTLVTVQGRIVMTRDLAPYIVYTNKDLNFDFATVALTKWGGYNWEFLKLFGQTQQSLILDRHTARLTVSKFLQPVTPEYRFLIETAETLALNLQMHLAPFSTKMRRGLLEFIPHHYPKASRILIEKIVVEGLSFQDALRFCPQGHAWDSIMGFCQLAQYGQNLIRKAQLTPSPYTNLTRIEALRGPPHPSKGLLGVQLEFDPGTMYFLAQLLPILMGTSGTASDITNSILNYGGVIAGTGVSMLPRLIHAHLAGPIAVRYQIAQVQNQVQALLREHPEYAKFFRSGQTGQTHTLAEISHGVLGTIEAHQLIQKTTALTSEQIKDRILRDPFILSASAELTQELYKQTKKDLWL